MNAWPTNVRIVEVGPRDGLQNEVAVSTEAKIALVNALADAGLRTIETGSFVSPKWVPQMADSAQVFAGIARKNGVTYSALTPNLQGYRSALVLLALMKSQFLVRLLKPLAKKTSTARLLKA